LKKINEFVEKILEDVPHTENIEQIREEIRLDMEEKVQDLTAKGRSQEDAINKVIVDFGDIDEIKKELDLGGSKKVAVARLNFNFSLWGSALLITLFVFTNLYYTPESNWWVYPTFAILWWPLAMLYNWNRKNEEAK
jgi:hypothetical protein